MTRWMSEDEKELRKYTVRVCLGFGAVFTGCILIALLGAIFLD